MTTPVARVVVMASGSGSNLQALIDATRQGALEGRAAIVLVISHTPTALALERARRAGIEAIFVAPPRRRDDRAAWERALAERVAAAEPDLIVLAGWMRILDRTFLDRFPDPRRPGQARILNLHPALPGELPGLDAIARAWDEAQRGARTVSGVMVHVVVPEVDAGPVVASEVVPLAGRASLAEFEAAMHAAEHRVIVQAVTRFLDVDAMTQEVS